MGRTADHEESSALGHPLRPLASSSRPTDRTSQLTADRAAAEASLEDPRAVATLLKELRMAGAEEAALTLADRAVNAGMFDDFLACIPGRGHQVPLRARARRNPGSALGMARPSSQPSRFAAEHIVEGFGRAIHPGPGQPPVRPRNQHHVGLIGTSSGGCGR